MDPNTQELEKRMQPGELSVKGFLAPGEHLEDVIANDARTLEELRISYKAIADKLEQLIELGEKHPGKRVRLGPFEIKAVVYPGFQLCPWTGNIHQGQCTSGGWVSHASVDWHITNRNNHMEMNGPGLIVHLIREHHFFEGPGSHYRVDPEKLAQLLELIPK